MGTKDSSFNSITYLATYVPTYLPTYLRWALSKTDLPTLHVCPGGAAKKESGTLSWFLDLTLPYLTLPTTKPRRHATMPFHRMRRLNQPLVCAAMDPAPPLTLSSLDDAQPTYIVPVPGPTYCTCIRRHTSDINTATPVTPLHLSPLRA
ncbi:hypothetical protein BKA81DRAFT_80065 [Phyllosticta paracitricarpa]